MSEKPLVSVCCITYNHGPFIRQCLDGILMQTTNFSFEVLIHDDASTDETQAIIKEYQRKFPGIVKPMIQKENQYSKGLRGLNIHFNFSRAQGKYIAMCEGDDYWTDPYKLQKQVDFLENNPDFMLTCGGYVKNFNGITEEIVKDNIVSKNQEDEEGFIFVLDDLQKNWITKTLTCTFRNSKEIFSKITNYQHIRDIHLYYHILKNGRGYYFKQLLGVYNIHNGGIFSLTTETSRLTTHYYIYRELYDVNQDDFTRKMFFNILLNVINFNLSESKKSEFSSLDSIFKAMKMINSIDECFAFLKALIPRQIRKAFKK